MIEQDKPPEQPDLLAAAVTAWPILGRWKTRLDNNRRIQTILGIVRSKRFQQSLRIAIVGTFLVFVALAIFRTWTELQQHDWQAAPRYLVLAIVGFPLAYLPNVWCWHWLVRRTSRFANLRVNAYIYFLSSLGRYMPGAIWYIVGRAYWYKDYNIPTSQVIISTFWENVIFISSGLIVYTLMAWQQYALGGLAIAATLLAYPALLNRLIGIAQQKLGYAQLPSMRPLDILAFYVALGVAWAAGGLLLWWVTRAIFPLEINTLPYLIGIWGLAGAISTIAAHLVGGLGIRELTLGALLSQVMPVPVAAVVALVFRFTLTASEGAWALTLSWLVRPRTQ